VRDSVVYQGWDRGLPVWASLRRGMDGKALQRSFVANGSCSPCALVVFCSGRWQRGPKGFSKQDEGGSASVALMDG